MGEMVLHEGSQIMKYACPRLASVVVGMSACVSLAFRAEGAVTAVDEVVLAADTNIVVAAGDTLKIEASRGLDEKRKKLGFYRIGEGITGHVAETGRSHIIPDLAKVRHGFPARRPVRSPESRNAGMVPRSGQTFAESRRCRREKGFSGSPHADRGKFVRRFPDRDPA